MKEYRRMTWTDRLIIERAYNRGDSFRAVARQVGFALSSVYTEIQHGLYPHMGAETSRRPYRYSAQIAQDYADWQATSKGTPIKLDHDHAYASFVSDQILQGHSPDQIIGTLKKSGKWTVSTPTLYRYIDKGYIPNVTNKNLQEKSVRKRTYRTVRAKRPPKGRSIESRPETVDTRNTCGHWELDSVIGKAKGKSESILVLTERKTRYEIILKVPNKTANATLTALEATLSKYPKQLFQTITVDNGSEFQSLPALETETLKVYYCHPYTSCERGSNERNNRIIRRYIPKGKSMKYLTQADCDRIAADMNDMPRKILGYATAREFFEQELAVFI